MCLRVLFKIGKIKDFKSEMILSELILLEVLLTYILQGSLLYYLAIFKI
jgi:hypothetical protein